MQKKWYLSTWVIVIMFAAWIFIIPPIIGIVLAILRLKQEKKNELMFEEAQADLQKMKDFNESIGFHRYEDVTSKVEEINLEIQELLTEKETKKEEIILEAKAEKDLIIQEMNEQKDNLESVIISLNQKISELNNIIAQNQSKVSDLNISISELNEKEAKKTKQLTNQENKLRRLKELYKSVEYCIQNFFAFTPQSEHLLLSSNDFDEVEKLAPTIMSQLHCMNIKDLRKAYRDNDKNIDTILNQYSSRYTTKANIAIYSLMVIALRSELQNILLNLKYEKLDNAIDEVKAICSKYLSIAGNGNQSISGTLTKFIGEIEYLFINAVKIEYNYYVKKEQARQEQLALKEQMRQEAEERKALEAEKKKIAQEESKFNSEISKLNEQLQTASDKETELLNYKPSFRM